jgi:hypothetical protein
VPWGAVDEGLVTHAHQHHLRVFSVLERMSDLHAHFAAGLDGVITSDPRAVREAVDVAPDP